MLSEKDPYPIILSEICHHVNDPLLSNHQTFNHVSSLWEIHIFHLDDQTHLFQYCNIFRYHRLNCTLGLYSDSSHHFIP